MASKIFSFGKNPPKLETIRIVKSKGRFSGHLTYHKYRDKDTRQVVIYLPALELSGYGSTEKKAVQMLNNSMHEFSQLLFKMSVEEMENELAKYGFKHSKFKNKEFSKSYIDQKGVLQNFNAVADEIETGLAVA